MIQAHAITLMTILKAAYEDRLEISLVALLVLLMGLLLEVPLKRLLVLAAVTVMAGVAGIPLLLTNTQPAAMPLLTTCALLLLSEIVATHHRERTLADAPLQAMALLLILIPASLDAVGLVAAVKEKIAPSMPVFRFSEPHLAALEFSDCGTGQDSMYCHANDNGRRYVQITQDGLDLIHQYGLPDESVAGMDLSNPFSYGSLRKPAHGGSVVLGATNINKDHVPPRRLLIGDASLLLVPKFETSPAGVLQSILRTYPEILGRDYRLVAESGFWSLYRRAEAP
jgi:hypothetical protein